MLSIQELEPTGLHKNIYIGGIGQVNLKAYQKHVMDVVFAKPLPDLKAVVLDGHSKVFVWVVGPIQLDVQIEVAVKENREPCLRLAVGRQVSITDSESARGADAYTLFG